MKKFFDLTPLNSRKEIFLRINLSKKRGFRLIDFLGEVNKKPFFLAIFLLIFSFHFLNLSHFAFAPKKIIIAQNIEFKEEKEKLEEELKKIEKEIEAYQQQILATQKKAKTLKNELSILENQIRKLNLEIKATKLSLERINQEIYLQEQKIDLKKIEINKEKELLKKILQNLYQEESDSLIEIILKNPNFSDFFAKIRDLELLQFNLKEKLQVLRDQKQELEKQKEELLEKKEEFVALSNLQILQKKKLLNFKKEKDYLLKITQGKEKKYQEILKEKQKLAAEIRNRIYELMGIGKPITFGDAVKFAEYASSLTGVRPALILAVITQESELGKNVGTCNRKGDPPSKSWRKVMKPDRDWKPFQQIIKELQEAGYPYKIDEMPVSCPMKDRYGNYIGWGGAMGPAQFIPSTWMLYKDRIAKLTGHNPPSPWNIQDAFVACALLLKDNGADRGSWQAEWQAAMKYFCGRVNYRFRFYGDSVMSLAKKYEEEIKILKNQ